MRKTKQMLALGMSVAMLASMTACTGTQTGGTEGESSSAPESESETEEAGDGYADTGVTVEAGKGIDFEDGNSAFLALNTILAGANEGEISVVDFNGSKAAKIEVADKTIGVDATGALTETPVATPYIAIDAAGLLGDAVADVKSIQMDVALEYSDGGFYAVSGSIYAGNSAVAESATWSLYMENKNPKTITMDLASTVFEGNVTDIFMVSVTTVAAPSDEIPTIYIDNIIFKDADGNALTVDSSAEMAEEALGIIDWSNGLVEVMGETDLGIGGETGNTWWPTASNGFTFFEEIAENQGYTYVDPSLLTPGSIITIYFTPGPDVDQTWMVPYLRCMQWADLTDADGNVLAEYDNPITFATTDFQPVLEKDEEGNFLETSKVNKSYTIVQISYDQIAEASGDPEWPLHTQWMGVADMGAVMTIDKVTVGMPMTGDVVALPNATGSSSGWGQAVQFATIKNDGGVFDPAVITPGTVFVVEFTTTEEDAEQPYPLEMICQSWSGGEGWAKVSPYACADGKAYFSYDDMVAAYLSDDFVGTLDNLIIGDCNSSLTVVSVGYIPGEE